MSGRHPLLSPGPAGTALLASLLCVPVLVVAASAFYPAGEVWRHLVDTVLAEYVSNSLILMLGVGAGTLLVGVSTAWLTVNFRFPGARVLEWGLLLPLAFPAYIIAYTYTGMLDYAGPVQTALRDTFGWSRNDYWFPEVRSLGGAVAMLTLVLYPYVYLLARSAFLEQSSVATDVARTLGCGPVASFFRVTLPAARPALIAGLSLAMMETLADFGTVQFFGVPVFTNGIYRTWFGLGDAAAAAQLAAVLLGFVFTLVMLEQWSRRGARYTMLGSRSRPIEVRRLRGAAAVGACAACALPLALGFLLPAGQLTAWALGPAGEAIDAKFLHLVWNSVSLSGGAAALALVLALLFAYTRRLHPVLLVRAATRVVTLGYAVPGTVVAVGVMLPFAWLDNTVDGLMRSAFGVSTGLLLSGTLAAVMFAYVVRFLSVSLQTVDAGLARVTRNMDEAGRSLGYRAGEVVWRVHVPMLRGSLLTAVLLVFVDVMKELPATLILRPFDFNTLAVRAYELAGDERLEDASTAAIAIVAAGLVPVLLLSVSIARTRRRAPAPERRPVASLDRIPASA